MLMFNSVIRFIYGNSSCMGGDRFDADVQLSDQVYIWESSCMGGDRFDADVQLRIFQITSLQVNKENLLIENSEILFA